MDQRVTFYEDMAVLHTDQIQLQENAESSMDQLVAEAVAGGSYYARMTATKTDTWMVSVEPGAIYMDGARYRLRATAELDTFNSRPLQYKKIIALLATGSVKPTDPELRDFAIDAEGTSWEERPVSTAAIRSATISQQSGVEAAVPEAPATPAGAVLVALVTVGTSGVESVEMQEQNRLPQTLRNKVSIDALEAFMAQTEDAVASLRSDLASLGAAIEQRALKSSVSALSMQISQLSLIAAKNTEAIGRLSEEVASTSHFLMTNFDTFMTDSKSATGHVDYAARVSGGLFFPHDTSDNVTGGLQLQNPHDDSVVVVNNMLSPKVSASSRSLLTGPSTNLFVNTQQYSVVTHTKKKVSRWNNNQNYGAGPAEYRYTQFAGVPGVTWNAQSGKPDSSETIGGVKWNLARYDETSAGSGTYRLTWVRVYDQWQESFYYVDESTTTTKDSQGRAQTILNANGGSLQNVSFWVDRANAGDIDVVVCKCDENGKPDIQRIVTEVTVQSSSVVAGQNKVPIEPSFFNPGELFAVGLMTTGAYQIQTTNRSVSNGQHYALTAANQYEVPGSEGDHDLRLLLDFSTYEERTVYVDLKPLALGGGFDSVGFNTPIMSPPNCSVGFEVQNQGIWTEMNPGETTDGMDWSLLPDALPFRVVFKGTRDSMPSIGIGPLSSLLVGKASNQLTHVSEPLDVGAGNVTSEVRVRVRVDNFDEAKHDLAVTLLAGSEIAASKVSDTVVDHNTIHRTAIFNDIAPTQSFQVKLSGSTTDTSDLFTIIDRFDYVAV